MPNTPKLTTAGSILIKHMMPTEASKDSYDLHRVLDKPGMSALVNSMLTNGGESAHETINDLGKLFFNKATELGASTPLSDYENSSDERNAIINEFSIKFNEIKNSKKSKPEINAALSELTGKYNKIIEKQNLWYLLGKDSMAARMAATGARGNPTQLAVGTSSMLAATNIKGDLVPLVIKHSFAEGLTPGELFAASYLGRSSTVLAQLSTSLPGSIFKKLSPNLFGEVISMDDCGTKNGILAKVVDKKSVLGRVQAVTNKLIDEQYYNELLSSTKENVKVRSVLTCEARSGLCKKCFGLMASGKMPNIGENVGIIAAQSISEVLTQAMLSTKHRSTVGSRSGNAYDQAANLLLNPSENFRDQATLSTINGKVSKIVTTPLGDHNVFIDEKKHFVPIEQNVIVKEGDEILQGSRVSTGTINPRELVHLRGIGAGREYMSSELRDIYKGGLDPRHFELVAKSLIKHVQVVDPGESGFLPGDKITVNDVAKYLENNKGLVTTDKAEGKVLAKGVLGLTPGTFLDGNHISDLKSQGVTKVEVSTSGLKVAPIVAGLQTVKLLSPDFISRLSFNKLQSSLENAAAHADSSEIHSHDPVLSYVIGSEFGEGHEGKY